MKILYRTSQYWPTKSGQFSNRQYCQNNFLNVFRNYQDDIYFICDNISEEMKSEFNPFSDKVHYTSLGNSGSFRYSLDFVTRTFHDDEIILFQENDYLHIEGAPDILLEGFETGADYVTLYDHADKYQHWYNNDSWGGQSTKVLLTRSTHWKQIFSTTMTFAAKIKTLKQDYGIIIDYLHQDVPRDYEMWQMIIRQGRKLISPIPGYSTHCIEEFKTPLIHWNSI